MPSARPKPLEFVCYWTSEAGRRGASNPSARQGHVGTGKPGYARQPLVLFALTLVVAVGCGSLVLAAEAVQAVKPGQGRASAAQGNRVLRSGPSLREDPATPALQMQAAAHLAEEIDRFIAAGWVRDKVVPAGLCDDAEYVRRVYLDLVGRIPSREEAEGFCHDPGAGKRGRLIERLMTSGEYPQHWRENLNGYLMGGPPFGGDGAWRQWLEKCLKDKRGWDDMARAMLLAGADRAADAGAWQFLLSRFAQGQSGLDVATRDVSRLFFGVDIQCARCHKHPEVNVWKQATYWGMAAFWNRSYPLTVKGKVYLAERATGEVEFSNRSQITRVARPVFLTGETLNEPARAKVATPARANPATPAAAMMEDPADYLIAPEAAADKTHVPVPKFSRRQKLVATAINGREPYFKRAAVNYVWAQLMGRGLVEPIDQMHEGNPPSHPELLQFLADDFAAHRFDLAYLIRGIVNSRTYQLSSRRGLPSGHAVADSSFGCGQVRPLSLHQLATSVLVAAGYQEMVRSMASPKVRSDAGTLRAQFEAQYSGGLATLVTNLSTGPGPYQPGIREALFEANSQAFGDLIAKGGLAGRLAGMRDDRLAVEEAFWCVLSRPPSTEEAARFAGYLGARGNRRPAACGQVIWALVTASEFRFGH